MFCLWQNSDLNDWGKSYLKPEWIGTGDELQWYSTCSACTKPWVESQLWINKYF